MKIYYVVEERRAIQLENGDYKVEKYDFTLDEFVFQTVTKENFERFFFDADDLHKLRPHLKRNYNATVS